VKIVGDLNLGQDLGVTSSY